MELFAISTPAFLSGVTPHLHPLERFKRGHTVTSIAGVVAFTTFDGLSLKETDSGNEKASLPKLLVLANQMSDELRGWCEKEFAKQSGRTSLPEFGLDVFEGDIRPVAHAILDVLSPNE